MAVIPFEDSDFIWGQAGIAGTGITEGEKLSITSRLTGLEATPIPVNIGDLNDVNLFGASNEEYLGYMNGVWYSLGLPTKSVSGAIQIVIDGGGSTITTGVKTDLYLPFAFTLQSWVALANQSGAIQVDVWRDSYIAYPPTDADSITGSTPIVIPATNSRATAGAGSGGMTGWDLTMDAGTTLRFNVDSATSIQRVTIALVYTRTI